MRRYIIFKAEQGEVKKYLQAAKVKRGECFYRICNAGNVKNLTAILAEFYDSSNKGIPEPGYRLTESVVIAEEADINRPNRSTHFRDNGWEVTRSVEYKAEEDSEFDSVCICYCAYRPLENPQLKKFHILE
jgi:hypothetical protein